MTNQTELNETRENVLSFIPTGEFYFTKGIKAFQRNDLLTAKKYLIRACELDPHEPVFTCQLAITLSELEDYEQSNVLLNNIITKVDPNMYECHYFMANNYAYLGQFSEAKKQAKLYLKYEPDGDYSDDVKELLDVIELEIDEMEFSSPDQLITSDEDRIIEKQEYVRRLLANGKFKEAIEKLNEMIQEYPDYWPGYNNLALAYYYEGETELAKSLLQKVLDENPGNLHALCNLTVFSYYEGQNIETLEKNLLKVYPISLDHRYKLGVTFSIIGNYEQGYKWLRTLINMTFPLDASFYYWYSYASYYTGKVDIAKKAWKKLLLIQPDKKGSEPWNTK